MNIDKAKGLIVEACHHFKNMGYLAAADGNISHRLDRDRILMTPSGMNKQFISGEQISMLDTAGMPISGTPSSEKLVHLAIYDKIADAKWVIHAHPPYSIAWSLNQDNATEMVIDALPEVILGVGRIPIVPYFLPGGIELSEAIAKEAVQHKALIMRRHGVLAWGEDWEEAVNGIERVEHAAKIICLAMQIGGFSTLSSRELAAVKDKRSRNAQNRTL